MANLPTSLDQALGHGVAAKASISAQARGLTVANGSTRGVFKSSMEVVITSPTKRPRTHVRAQAVSNRTCDAACFAAQEGGNDAIYTHQPLAHAKKDVA